MVAVEEIKKSKIAYEHIEHVICTNSNTSIDFNFIISFNESDLEIEIETYLPVDNLQRGWVGDIFYEASSGINIETCEKVNGTYQKRIKDVLLARVNSYKDGQECITFTYTFLKY